MSTRSRVWVIGLAAVALATLGASLFLVPGRDTITLENLDKIAPGMPASSVAEILGREPDKRVSVGGIELQHVWFGRAHVIWVNLDDNGFVAGKMSRPVEKGRESFLERMLSWFEQ